MCLGIPGQVVELDQSHDHLAMVDVGGVRRQVNVGLVAGEDPPLSVGEWVLIHVGFAMARIDEEEADRTFEFLKQLDVDQWETELQQFQGSELATE